ncbi:penicillin-binding transpeptidase domain-containing protein [Oscillibacter sp.]|jgi:penicillin-binding protein 2|uniref:penicillin-binding transpeptidase domain-containing protein n=1 Tax=Oscillibacter sp. TaxID=1945593 RepID=UPI0026149CBB|nr:penicillin-binding transpeptidase domain-containing protein [Oscillibacter sp.]
MDQHESRNFRLYFLGVLLAAVLLVYLGVLYSVQVVHHQDYATQSVHSIARPETVEASRGVITDRNGRLLVGNRSTYNLTFDPSLLKEGEDQNGAILRLIQLCQANGVDWIENLPISRQLPYTYTLDQLGDSVLKRRFLSYLKALDPSREALTAYLLQHPETVAPRSEDDPPLPELPEPEGELTEEQEALRQRQLGEDLLDLLASKHLTAQLLTAAGITPQTLLEWMREDFDLAPSLSLGEARLVLGIQYELYLRRIGTTVAYILAEDINMEFISLINDGGYSGAKVTSSYAREIQTSSAAHILGMVGPIYAEDDMEALRAKGYSGDEIIGRSGAEAAFEDYLRGTDGRRVVSVNSDGKITGEYYTKDPRPGNNVELTIDLKFQQAAEEALAATVSAMSEKDGNTTRGAGLAVVKVGTGEVLALASYPLYDLAAYIQDGEYRAQLNTDESMPLVNRAVSGRYSPGSTYKPLIAVAALEEGVVSLKEKILDPGYWVYPDIVAGTKKWTWYCWNRGGHGRLNVTQAITASCNTFFYEMGYRLGIEKIGEYADAFGFGRTTGIEIGDAAGLVAGPEEKEARGEIWYGGDTVQAAIGQSDNLFTPLQIANYMATLVSGGKHYDAHLLKTAKTYDNSQVVAAGSQEPSNVIEISDSTLNAVKTGMHNLTKTTLAPYFNSCVVSAGAKTGTAQLGGDITNNGCFVCFAPYDEPEIAVALVIEQGNAGAQLASTAVSVINAYFTPDEAETLVTGENQLLP